MRKKILLTTAWLSLFAFVAIFNSCDSAECEDCVTIPPSLNTYATQIEARDYDIDSATAADWIKRYETYKDSICNNMVGMHDSVLNYYEAFNKQALLDLLCLNNCIGIKIYQGMDTNFNVHNIILGADQNGKDLYYKNLLKDSLLVYGKEHGLDTTK